MNGYKNSKALLHMNNISIRKCNNKKCPIQNQTKSVKYQAINLAKKKNARLTQLK